jgi:hypothetical protein
MEPMMFPDEWPIFMDLVHSLPPDSKIVEWGSGGSTVKLSEQLRVDQKLISIEHNRQWYERTLEALTLNLKSNWRYLYKPSTDLYPHNADTLNDENPIGLDYYIFPDESILEGDMFFIDGICRATIAVMLLAKAKNRNAIILMHDYAQRQHYYDWAIRLFPKTERVGTSFLRLYMQ